MGPDRVHQELRLHLIEEHAGGLRHRQGIRLVDVAAEGAAPLTMTWESWRQAGGVYFAQKRTIAETGETVEVNVLRALAGSPPDAF